MGDSDWKQSAIDRKDFRRSKEQPEIPKKRKSKKRKNRYRLVVKNFSFGLPSDEPSDYVLGAFVKRESAEQALQNQQQDLLWKNYKIEIEEI